MKRMMLCSNALKFSEKASFFTLDVIGDISFGSAFGFLSEDQDLWNYHRINAESMTIMNFLSTMPWLTDIAFSWPFRLALPRDGDQAGFGRLIR